MKKMLILLSAVLVLAGGCCNNCKAEDMINFVPADADGIVSIDAERLVNLSHFKDLRKENAEFNENWSKFESELGKYGLKTSDLPSRVMVFFKVDAGTQNAGILAITKISEAKLVDLLKANKDKVSYLIKTISERKAYVISQKDKKADTIIITYLKTNLVLICDEDKAEKFCKNVGKNKNQKLITANQKANKKALVNILFTKKDKTAPASGTSPQGPMDSVKSAVIALDLVGKNQKDINLKADLDCTDAQSAMQMTTQLKTVVMIMGMQLAQDPALGKSVTEAIKIDQKDANIKIDISISEPLFNKIKTVVEAKKKQALARRMAPTPMKAAPVKSTSGKRK